MTLDSLVKFLPPFAEPKKPDVHSLDVVYAQFPGIRPEETIILGDRLLTDVLLGNTAGAKTILVKPFPNNGDPLKISAARFYETLLYGRTHYISS